MSGKKNLRRGLANDTWTKAYCFIIVEDTQLIEPMKCQIGGGKHLELIFYLIKIKGLL